MAAAVARGHVSAAATTLSVAVTVAVAVDVAVTAVPVGAVMFSGVLHVRRRLALMGVRPTASLDAPHAIPQLRCQHSRCTRRGIHCACASRCPRRPGVLVTLACSRGKPPTICATSVQTRSPPQAPALYRRSKGLIMPVPAKQHTWSCVTSPTEPAAWLPKQCTGSVRARVLSRLVTRRCIFCASHEHIVNSQQCGQVKLKGHGVQLHQQLPRRTRHRPPFASILLAGVQTLLCRRRVGDRTRMG